MKYVKRMYYLAVLMGIMGIYNNASMPDGLSDSFEFKEFNSVKQLLNSIQEKQLGIRELSSEDELHSGSSKFSNMNNVDDVNHLMVEERVRLKNKFANPSSSVNQALNVNQQPSEDRRLNNADQLQNKNQSPNSEQPLNSNRQFNALQPTNKNQPLNVNQHSRSNQLPNSNHRHNANQPQSEDRQLNAYQPLSPNQPSNRNNKIMQGQSEFVANFNPKTGLYEINGKPYVYFKSAYRPYKEKNIYYIDGVYYNYIPKPLKSATEGMSSDTVMPEKNNVNKNLNIVRQNLDTGSGMTPQPGGVLNANNLRQITSELAKVKKNMEYKNKALQQLLNE